MSAPSSVAAAPADLERPPWDVLFLLLRAGAVPVLLVAAGNLLVLDPAQTLTSDLRLLYEQAGPLAVAWVGSSAAWLAGALWTTWRTTLALRDERRRSGLPLTTCVAAWSALLGGWLSVHLQMTLAAGIGMYGVAQRGGYAPRAASLGSVTRAELWLTAVLLLVATALSVWRLLRRAAARARVQV